ncbi:DUF4242 domain-containing protein [Mycoplana dimorpha]|uniref:Uncharacterized protein DUF4242 n=1 Tax=Mycoplana dimorpha TaxID=28320 RepID=A0A2T5BHS7_MYCDI|nr:DUF4242 domain-containing protein [Mycoplana dimorpha]PTM98498.1 uncharacterized protein DUF4242 [Mycoplana dimorpha]
MPTFIIERDIPGADNLSAEELSAISARSNQAMAELGEPYKWITSYVAGDKFYCVHEADSEDVVRAHASRGNFPANKVTEITAIIGPTTATGGKMR